jgi:hypothetical protein
MRVTSCSACLQFVLFVANEKLHSAEPARPHHLLIEILQADVLITYQYSITLWLKKSAVCAVAFTKIQASWGTEPCRFTKRYLRFGGAYCFPLQGPSTVLVLPGL